MQSRLREIYEKEIVPELVKEFGYKNMLAVPKLSKIVLNMGVGEAVADKKKLDAAVVDLMAIAAQKPIVTHAKKSIATYRLREGQAFGIKEHLIFPEISIDKIDSIRGMDIVIATTAKTDDEARALLTKIGLPLVLK